MLVNDIEIFLKRKRKKCQYDQYKNLTEDKKQRLVEYGKNYCRMQKIKTG